MTWTRDEERRARRAADVVAGGEYLSTKEDEEGVVRQVRIDQARLSLAVQEVYREAWERGREAASAAMPCGHPRAALAMLPPCTWCDTSEPHGHAQPPSVCAWCADLAAMGSTP